MSTDAKIVFIYSNSYIYSILYYNSEVCLNWIKIILFLRAFIFTYCKILR